MTNLFPVQQTAMNSKRECAPRLHLAPLFNRGGVTVTIRCHALLFILALGVAGAGCNRQQQPVRARNPAAESPPPLVPASGSSQLDKLAGGRLPVYELKMDPNELAGLERSAFSNERHPATFIAGGETYEAVIVRYRGAWARSWPRKPLKIFFNHDKPFQGHY